jgi:hypothetical protein
MEASSKTIVKVNRTPWSIGPILNKMRVLFNVGEGKRLKWRICTGKVLYREMAI